MILRPEEAGDAPAVRALTVAAFVGMQEADLVEALRASGDAVLSLVAEERGAILGHVLFSRLVAPAASLALAPVSVHPDRQRQGIGSRLIVSGLEQVRQGGWDAVFVLGEPAYYGRFGFSKDMAAGFATAYPRDYFMGLELRPGILSGLRGEVVYPAPFGALD
ncbi:MAG: GNAT family N-acetyltransferase [Parvibaculaceae bacterium]